MVSSVSGLRGTPMSSIYASSKHAMEGFSDALRVEVSHFNISVSVVEPAYVATNIFNKSAAIAQEALSDEAVSSHVKRLYPQFYTAKAAMLRAKGSQLDHCCHHHHHHQFA